MRRSQPIRDDKAILEKLGIKEETDEEKAAGEKVVKVETVDEMFDFTYKDTLIRKLLRPFVRLKRHIEARRRSRKNFRKWRSLFAEYYSWDTYSFLPMFIKHLELYIEREKKYGISTKECKEYKISTAQEAADIMKRLVEDDYSSAYHDAVEEKWGKFPYEKTTYANGSTGFRHLTPNGYDTDMHAANEKANADQERDLKRLGELIEKNMPDWWD